MGWSLQRRGIPRVPTGDPRGCCRESSWLVLRRSDTPTRTTLACPVMTMIGWDKMLLHHNGHYVAVERIHIQPSIETVTTQPIQRL
jgi:hypothetical protein